MIYEEITKLLAEQLNIEPETITRDSKIVEDLHTDSLDMVEMLIALEDKYDITVPDEDAKNLDTIGKLVDYVEKKVAEKKCRSLQLHFVGCCKTVSASQERAAPVQWKLPSRSS